MEHTYKDMLVREADGRPRLTFRNRQGAVALEDVSVEIASTLLQAGDRWGAREANLLLARDEDGAPALNLDGGTY